MSRPSLDNHFSASDLSHLDSASTATSRSAPSQHRNAEYARSPVSPLSSPTFDSFPRPNQRPPQAPSDRARLAKKAYDNPARNDIRDAVTRDALKEQLAQKVAVVGHPPRLASLANSSPLPSPTTMSFSPTPDSAHPEHRANMMQRKASIESTSSLLSNATNSTTRTGALAAYRASPDIAPADLATLIAAAGSPEAALQKLINEKQQTASHNAQLWRLVEKQRAMILGLNKDLEKSLKAQERYRKKLKDYITQSEDNTALAVPSNSDLLPREESQSPAHPYAATTPSHPAVQGAVMNGRKVSDTSSEPSQTPGRSDTPQEAGTVSLSAFPATPQSRGSVKSISDAHNKLQTSPPMSPKGSHSEHKQADSLTLPNSPLRSPQSISSPKQANRKPPPAPLQLSPPTVSVTNNIIDPSDSEYDDDEVDSARAEQERRGRRKTREDDDRERELAAMEEVEHRSRSKKGKSKSKNQAPLESDQPTAPSALESAESTTLLQPDTQDPATILRRTQARALPQHVSAPALLSPGLPMSPRPGDRPLNSPMPRPPNGSLSAMPLSPKSGIAGLPLSPRAPRQPLPLPPQTPTGFASPHLARAEAYHQQAQAHHGSIADRLNESTSDKEASSTKPPGEVYSELVSEQYPDLLLPPNALPSILVKTSSSRMRPSRLSYIAPKHPDDNPVMTLAVHRRLDNKQLWRVEKTLGALAVLDAQVKAACTFRERLPDKALFAGHAPARIDARRAAIDAYFENILESLTDEKSASVVCKFLSTDSIAADSSSDHSLGAVMPDNRPDTPVNRAQRAQLAGYLTKRGKNFGGWKARYFVLDSASLRYFEAPGGAHLGSIRLQNAQIGKQAQSSANQHEDEDNQFRHAFLILEPKKKDSSSLVRHVLCAESDEERDNWVNALLQYVDMKDEEETSLRPGNPGIKLEAATAPRSPRLQKSNSDLKGKDTRAEMLRAVNYDQVTAGDAPTMGVTGGKPDSPSASPSSDSGPSTHPSISGPTNLTVISNTENWGMKPPPTPTLIKELGKDKKRSMFSAFRGRSSSDLPLEKAPGGHYSSDSQSGVRAVFGAPLADAADYARPPGVNTELPMVVYRCLEYLTIKNAIAEEGIFRLSGSNTVMKALKDRFNTEGDVDLAHDNNWYDPHAIAGVLKLYLRELPASILTRELHLDFLPCLELNHKDKVVALNILVNRLPTCNRALLEALTGFLLVTVNNASVNKMNTRNVGIVFSPTLALPAPLISALVEDQPTIFGPPIDESEWPEFPSKATAETDDLRSPRKQMFTDLPTPAYNQTTFQSVGGPSTGNDHDYNNFQVAPQGEGGFASLNDALRTPNFQNSTSNGVPSPREVKARRRESGVMLLSSHMPQKKTSHSRLREEDSTE